MQRLLRNSLSSMSTAERQQRLFPVQTITQHHLLQQESWEQPMHRPCNWAMQVPATSISSALQMSLIPWAISPLPEMVPGSPSLTIRHILPRQQPERCKLMPLLLVEELPVAAITSPISAISPPTVLPTASLALALLAQPERRTLMVLPLR